GPASSQLLARNASRACWKFDSALYGSENTAIISSSSGISRFEPNLRSFRATRVAARTLAPLPIRDLLHRRLQPFRHLHDCSGCFRLERSPGGACTHWKAPPFTAHTLSGHSV